MVRADKKKVSGIRLAGWGLFLLLVSGWILATSYIAQQTEQHVRGWLVQQSSAPVYTELLSYQRAFLHAQAVFRFRSRDAALDAAIKGWVVRADIRHGPIIFNQYNLQPALARLSVSLDKSWLTPDTRELMSRLFGDHAPFNAEIRVDYQQRLKYQLTTAALDYQVADSRFQFSAGRAQGELSLEQSGHTVRLHIDDIVYRKKTHLLQAMRNKLVLQLPARRLIPLSAHLDTALVRSEAADYSGLTINFSRFKLSALADLLEVYEARYNLDQQITWTLEAAAYFQEGRDRLTALYHQQEETPLPEAGAMLSQLFAPGEAAISYLHKVAHRNAGLAYNHTQ